MFTWNCSALDVDNHSETEPGCGCFQLPSGSGNGSVHGGGSSRKRKLLRETELSFHKQVSSEKVDSINIVVNTRGILFNMSAIYFSY